MEKCPFFNSCIKTDESKVGEVMKRVEANNPALCDVCTGKLL